jgi:hypothetical protein
MHYAEFAEDEVSYKRLQSHSGIMLTSKKSTALLAAIKEYDANKWKVIGQKVGKPAKVRSPFFLTHRVICRSRSVLTPNRHASSTRRRTLVGSTEPHLWHSLHLPAFSAERRTL